MKIGYKRLSALVLSAGLTVPLTAWATNGYFSHAYGARSGAMAGATTALPEDSLAAATNPAGMGLVGDRADLELTFFNPNRTAQSGFLGGLLGQPLESDSDEDWFYIPAFGYNQLLANGKTTVGVTVYGNGGMNTDYPAEHPTPFGNVSLFGSTKALGVDLSQLVVAPTVAHQVHPNHTLGVSLLLGYQRFKATGLQNFCSLKVGTLGDPMCTATGGVGSAASDKGLTNQGHDSSFGWGARIGWVGKVHPNVTLGAAYSTKLYMSEFDDYDQLFAEQGDFDIPANASAGIAVQANPKTTITFDVQWIGYSDVKSLANAGPSLVGPNVFSEGQTPLGTDNGLGFGWDDMTTFKLGLRFQQNPKWTWRGGVSYGDQPIGDDQLAFNILAPAVIEWHASVGFSYRPTGRPTNEFTLMYTRAFDNEETGPFPEAFCTQGMAPCPFDTKLKMNQNIVSAGWSWEF